MPSFRSTTARDARTWAQRASVSLFALLVCGVLALTAIAPQRGVAAGAPRELKPVADTPTPDPRTTAYREVWQQAQKPHPSNPTNPLANRVWGVYQGPQDQVWAPYNAAKGAEKQAIARIAVRPRAKWTGAWVKDGDIRRSVTNYISASQNGDKEKLVQLAVFRMQPWEQAACKRAPSAAEQASYKRWITNFAAGIGNTPTMIVMQPDGPFLWCAPDRKTTSALLRFATQTLSKLPRTSVYIDAGAADWCENDKGNNPETCAGILKATGVQYARGFALDSTHYTGIVSNLRHGLKIVNILKRDGYGEKRFIIDTAKNGRPTNWLDMIPAEKGGLKDNARTCTTRAMTRCVTLGIPPTTHVWAARFGIPAAERASAAKYVDAFAWFGRPWLYNQADPFVKQRALDMARSTPWMAPLT